MQNDCMKGRDSIKTEKDTKVYIYIYIYIVVNPASGQLNRQNGTKYSENRHIPRNKEETKIQYCTIIQIEYQVSCSEGDKKLYWN